MRLSLDLHSCLLVLFIEPSFTLIKVIFLWTASVLLSRGSPLSPLGQIPLLPLSYSLSAPSLVPFPFSLYLLSLSTLSASGANILLCAPLVLCYCSFISANGAGKRVTLPTRTAFVFFLSHPALRHTLLASILLSPFALTQETQMHVRVWGYL